MRVLARLLPGTLKVATRAFSEKASLDPKFLKLATRMLNKNPETSHLSPVKELADRLSTLPSAAFRVLEVVHTTFKPKSHDS
jgi:hypothetical protein